MSTDAFDPKTLKVSPKLNAALVGVTLGISHVKMAGLHNKRTPFGEPITISSPTFDITKVTPLQAALDAVKKWHKYTLAADALELLAEYDVNPTTPNAAYQKIYLFVKTSEHKKHPVRDHFANSWYLTPTKTTT